MAAAGAHTDVEAFRGSQQGSEVRGDMLNPASVSDPAPRRAALAFWLGLAIVIVLALVPRLTYPLSRPVNWYNRSIAFWDALLAGEWAGTYRQYHPGVTTMWVAGLGLRLYMVANGWSSNDMYEAQTVTSGLPGQPHRAGVAALALVIAACIGLIYVLVVRLMNWPTAFVAGCLLALDPFYIAQSKVLHVDALLATLMMVSALFLLDYRRRGQRPSLLLSAVFAGLAGLTKSTAGFLVPYAVLVTAWPQPSTHAVDSDGLPCSQSWRARIGRIARDLAQWGIVAGGVFFVLWPAMWVRPWESLSAVVGAALFHIDTPHLNPNFFAGQVKPGDQGPLYYLATLAWKTTLITLPGLLASVVLLWRRRKGVRGDGPAWCLLIYLVIFAALMTWANKKGLRYLLPAFLAVDILAAWALAHVGRVLGQRQRLRELKWAPAAIVATALAAQAIAVLRVSPYYGTHHNLLLGGSQVAQHVLSLGEQGEGLDLAARFLSDYLGAERQAAGLQQRSRRVFQRNFEGQTVPVDGANVNYWVFQINPVQRRLNEELWGEIWDANRRSEPMWSVSFDGVEYAWIYRAYPHEPGLFAIDQPLDEQLGDHVRLVGFGLSADELAAGDTLTATLFWQSDGRIAQDYHVFVHLLDANGQLAAQHDGTPGAETRPTWTWLDSEVLEDQHLVDTSGLPAGTYALHAGMYDFGTGFRLPVEGSATGPAHADSVWLGDVTIGLP